MIRLKNYRLCGTYTVEGCSNGMIALVGDPDGNKNNVYVLFDNLNDFIEYCEEDNNFLMLQILDGTLKAVWG